jgi:hypothetical protein
MFMKLTVLSVVGTVLVNRWQQGWGVAAEERTAVLPGDRVVPEPAEQSTRAITIDAPPDRVWPWLVQIGADRAGFYSYDLLENAFGLGIHSADSVVPDWQDLHVGDVVYASRKHNAGWYVAEVTPTRSLVLQVADLKAGRPIRREGPWGWEFSWAFVLRPMPGGATRLVVRERVAFGSRQMRWLLAPAGKVSFVMTRRMMLGMKERVEGRRTTTG